MAGDGALKELASLSGLGRASAEMLVEAGVHDVLTLRAMGVEDSYRALRFRHGRRATTNFIYALDTALRGISWTQFGRDRKNELRVMARRIVEELERAR